MLAALLVTGALVAPSGLTAQAAAASKATQIISISPLSLVFGLIGAEYERRVSSSSALGVNGSYFKLSDYTYTSAEGKYRYYPQGTALEGFAISVSGGLTRVSSRDSGYNGSESGSAATVGTAVDYQWLTGAKKNFAITLGVGARRLIFLGTEVSGASLTLPTARISIGRAF